MDIPNEMLVLLFTYLPHSDRLAASETCTFWHEAARDKSFIKKQVVCFNKNKIPRDLFRIPLLTNFENFVLREVELRNQVRLLKFWREIGERIKYFELDQCVMQKNVFVKMLNNCPNLEELKMSSCGELFKTANLLAELKPECLKKLKSLNLSMNRYLSNALFHRLVLAANCVQDINFSECKISFDTRFFILCDRDETESLSDSVFTFHSILKFLQLKAHNINKLSFNKTLINGTALKVISKLKYLNLTSFSVYECDQLDIEGISSLIENQLNLTELNIGMCSKLQDKSLIAICSNLKHLKTLCISGCKRVTDVGMTELWNLKQLESVDISKCENVNREGIINGLCREVNEHLIELNVSSLNLEESTIMLLSEKLPNLRILNANFCSTSVTDNSVQAIFKNLLRLQHLRISQAEQVSDASITGIGLMRKSYEVSENTPKIISISQTVEQMVQYIQGTRITCENLVDDTPQGYSLMRLQNLITLDISGCNRISDVSLKYAFCSVQLRNVNFSECLQLTHEGLESLAVNCPSIEHINLTNCFNIRDQGVEMLVRKLHRLKYLVLRGCYLLTNMSIEFIIQNCKILKLLDMLECSKISPMYENMLSRLPTLHTILFPKPSKYTTEALESRMSLISLLE